ncbi:Golgi SNAP receptor complex member 2 [Xylographa carneopallida]|nr:Golgi SNAP receptor complex member 2 [Xylographa carneopallida]
MSISALFPDAQRALLRLQHDVSAYESAVDRSASMERSIDSTLASLLRLVQDMESLCSSEHPARREMWRTRIRAMSDEVLSIRAGYARVQQTQQRRQHEQAVRADLLSGAQRRRDGGSASGIDSLARENDSLLNSHRLLDEFTAMASASLDSLQRQRGALKGVHRKVLDVANSIGMSSSLLRMIERTETFNALLVATGAVVTCGVVGVVWWYYVRGR